MKGEIEETYLSDLHSRTRNEGQASFSDFGSTEEDDLGTSVAVITDPTGGIVEASDEFIPELGMPENELNNFRSIRSGLNVDDDVKRHNLAVEKTDIEEAYREHMRSDDEARQSIENLARRVAEGEKITLVCFEKEPKWCHRHVLKEVIEERAKELSG